MSNYVYECGKCGKMDIEHSIKDDAWTVCPKCGGTDFKRLISGNIGVIFKGSGWTEKNYNKGSK